MFDLSVIGILVCIIALILAYKFVRVMENSVSSFTRPALGSTARIGDLYDAQRDEFINISIFKEKLPPGIIHLQDINSSTLELVYSDKMAEKLNKLNINANLKLSIISGLVKLDGSGEYLDHHSSTDKGLKSSLLYDINTKHESLNIFETNLKEYISLEAVSNASSATHVVVGINWGAHLVVEAQHKYEKNSDKTKSEGELKACIEGLKSLILDAQGKIGGEKKEKNATANTNFSVKIFGDIIMETNKAPPQSMEEVHDLIKNVPNLIAKANDGKGKPVSYLMLPLSNLQGVLATKLKINNYMKQLQDSTVLSVSQVLDELISVKDEVYDLHRDILQHSFCVQAEDVVLICDLKTKTEVLHNQFRSELADAVIAIRSGKKEENELNRLIAKYNASSNVVMEIRQQILNLSQVTAKIEMINILKENYGVQHIGRNTSVESFVLQNNKGNVYLLYFNEKSKDDELHVWEKTRELFLHLAVDSKNENLKPTSNQLDIFGFVDCDVLNCTTLQNGIKISHYKNGRLITSDLFKDMDHTPQKCFAQSSRITSHPRGKPFDTTKVMLPCPGSLNGGPCRNEDQSWYCSKCENLLEFGFNQNFYCSCGYAPYTSFQFKCCDTKHGTTFIYFRDVALMDAIFAKMKPVKKINILLLGETGVGKSTWINSFANYLTYRSIQQAAQEGMRSLVPTQFTMRHKGERVTISTGSDDNESHIKGQSATQFPISHVFYTGTLPIQLIDTPGIGDTRGLKQDKENIKNILDHLSYIPEIHAICILLKPNETRLTVYLKYCIKELLIHLHKDAAKNIIFCFTNARTTFYEPGETYEALQVLLTEIPEVNIVLSEQTTYCLDNEGFRFLAALNHGIVFKDAEHESFTKSWDISVQETDRMIKYILSLTPHAVENTLSINDARRTIVELTKPIAEMSRNIQVNIAVLEDTKKEIKSHRGSKDELQKKLIIPIIDLEPNQLGYPRTVCTKCVDYLTVGSKQKTIYKTICHDDCQLKGVETDTVRCAELQNCWALYESNGRKCKKCGCSWDVHMHITYELEQVKKTSEDTNIKKLIEDKNKTIATVENTLKEVNERIDQFRKELKVILKVSSTFAIFLKGNAIVPYNDSLNDYMCYLIDEEKAKVENSGKKDILDGLRKMQEQYQKEKDILEEAITRADKGEQPITPKDVKKMEAELYNLPICGRMLKDIMAVAKAAKQTKVRCNYKNYAPSRSEDNMIQKTLAYAKNKYKKVVNTLF